MRLFFLLYLHVGNGSHACPTTAFRAFDIGQCDVETGECSTAPIEGFENGARLERWNDITGVTVNDLTGYAE